MTSAPISRAASPATTSPVTTTTRPTTGLASAAVTVSMDIARTSASWSTSGSDPRRRDFATVSRLTGMMTVQLTVSSLPLRPTLSRQIGPSLTMVGPGARASKASTKGPARAGPAVQA